MLITKSESRVSHRKPRIALYSPGMIGLGHMRRNLLIAQTVSDVLNSITLMIAEAREASNLYMPRGVDCLTLPAIRKEFNGNHEPRYLDLSVQELVKLRSQVIDSALSNFKPDVLIVDHLPRGAFQELLPALQTLYRRGNTAFVLGLRDILDRPATVRNEWLTSENEKAIRKYYDSIWIYGDPNVYDAVREYGLGPDISERITYTGYLDQRPRLDLAQRPCEQFLAELGLPPGRLALCVVGGGYDGARLAEAFSQTQLPENYNGVIVSGPYMPVDAQRRLRKNAQKNSHIRVLEFVSEPAVLLSCADCVIAMGGYNTVCEILSFEKSALIVPRAKSRYEQWIRAGRLKELGVLDVLHPDDVTAESLTRWLASEHKVISGIRNRIDFCGLQKLPNLLRGILTSQISMNIQARVGGAV